MATVPDERIDRLTALYRPRKTVYAQLQFSDAPGLVRGPGPAKGGNPFLEGVRNADLLIHVVRAFRTGFTPRQENEFMIKWLKGEHIKIKV